MGDEFDPLGAIENLPLEEKVIVIVSVLRSTRNTLSRIETKVDWVQRSLWGLIASIIVGIVIYILTPITHHAPSGSSNPPAAVVVTHK